MWHTLGAPLFQATLSLCVLVSTAWPCVCAFLCRGVCVCFFLFLFFFGGGRGGGCWEGGLVKLVQILEHQSFQIHQDGMLCTEWIVTGCLHHKMMVMPRIF